jgi:hypothetical protein
MVDFCEIQLVGHAIVDDLDYISLILLLDPF